MSSTTCNKQALLAAAKRQRKREQYIGFIQRQHKKRPHLVCVPRYTVLSTLRYGLRIMRVKNVTWAEWETGVHTQDVMRSEEELSSSFFVDLSAMLCCLMNKQITFKWFKIVLVEFLIR